jgi:hypothetical protein
MVGGGALTILVLFFLGGAGTSDQDATFTKYPAEAPLHGPPAKPQMVLPKARQFRTALRKSAAEGPNFNGHYRVATWGCGTTCMNWAVIDLIDGKIWFAQTAAYPCVPDDYEWGLLFEITSRLFYLDQCVEGVNGRPFNGRHVYEWLDGRPQLLRIEPPAAQGTAIED